MIFNLKAHIMFEYLSPIKYNLSIIKIYYPAVNTGVLLVIKRQYKKNQQILYTEKYCFIR